MVPRGGAQGGFFVLLFPVFHPPAFVSGLDDFTMMGQTIKHSGGHFLITEHLGPFTKVEIGGDNDGCLFVQLRDKMN